MSERRLPRKTHATLGNVRGGTVNVVNGGVERSETVDEAVVSDLSVDWKK